MRRSARVAVAADVRTSALVQLPPSLALRVFLLLPVNQRARACCVCRGWRAFLADPALWTRLDLSSFAKERLTDALLRGAAAKARGQLERLDLGLQLHAVTQTVLQEVLAANAGSLRELRLDVSCTLGAPQNVVETLAELGRAAPLLRSLEARVACKWEDAPRLMRAEPPLTSLQLCDLTVIERAGATGLERVSLFAAALSDPALQPTLSRLCIAAAGIDRPEMLDAVVDAVLARRQLRKLSFFCCPPPAPAPLARLLRSSTFAALDISGSYEGVPVPVFNTAGATLVADALRGNTTLKELTIGACHFLSNAPAACVLLRGLVRHPSLFLLHINDEIPNDSVAVGAALAELLTADSPALRHLYLPRVRLNDGGLAPIMDALPHNHHLRVLSISHTGASQAFSRDRTLPAIRANTSLVAFLCGGDSKTPAEVEARQLVFSRPRLHL
jgi:hypothetical protein